MHTLFLGIGQLVVGFLICAAVAYVPWFLGMAFTWDDSLVIKNWLIGAAMIAAAIGVGWLALFVGGLFL